MVATSSTTHLPVYALSGIIQLFRDIRQHLQCLQLPLKIILQIVNCKLGVVPKTDDKIYGGSAGFNIGNRLDGNEGNDIIVGGTGLDDVNGGPGNDKIDGVNDNDVLQGGEGNDDVAGGEGDDTIGGGDGSDILSRGLGNDRVVQGSPFGEDVANRDFSSDTINCGSGSDFGLIRSSDGDIANSDCETINDEDG
jgi:RTX calcium-binding nonapeptide repeat (4 copies)